MIKSVLKYAALLSLVALTTCGNRALDFDDDFAAAGAKKGVGPFTITFLTGDFPASITLGAAYTGPGDASLAEYDPGDGEWRTYAGKTITRLGNYIAFRGDWSTSAGNYYNLFNDSLKSDAYTCDFSGAFTAYPNHNSAYRQMFRNCTAVTAIRDNPVPVLTGAPAANMFDTMCFGMSGVTGELPSGFADTSGLTGAPGVFMLRYVCYGMSGVTGVLPMGFADTSGLTGAPAAGMFYQICFGMSGLTGGNLNLGTGITFTADNVDVLAYMFYGCRQWTGNVYWGDDLITDQIIPTTRIYTFGGCTSKPNYYTLDDNWK